MSYEFWQSIANTSWWIYLMFIYLSYIAYLATKPVAQDIRMFYFMLPVVIGVSILGMFTLITVTPTNLAAYAASLVSNALLGWLLCLRLNVRAVEGKKVLLMEGSWMISFIVIALFSIRYYLRLEISFDPTTYKSPSYSLIIMILYGWVAGLLIGRILFMRRVLKSGPYIAVDEAKLILSEH